jgi:hypothetical protein
VDNFHGAIADFASLGQERTTPDQNGDPPMTDNQTSDKDATSIDRGFVAAAIVVGAIAVCGVLLLVAGLVGPATAAESTGTPASGATAAAGGPSDPGGTADPGRSEQPRDPATPGGAATTIPDRSGRCALPDGDQEIPLTPPSDTRWEVFRRMVVPRSDQIGPAKVDGDGFRHCFAHSPTGAVFAAYSAVAAFADGRQAGTTAAKLLLPGEDAERMLAELEADSASGEDTPSQLAGFRIIDASQDRATIALAMRVQDSFVSATLTVVWHDSDWRVLPPRPGQKFGAPFAQQSDLSGFVPWGGV